MAIPALSVHDGDARQLYHAALTPNSLALWSRGVMSDVKLLSSPPPAYYCCITLRLRSEVLSACHAVSILSYYDVPSPRYDVPSPRY